MTREEQPPILVVKHPPYPAFLSVTLDELLLALIYTYVLAKILRNDAKPVQKLTPGLKNHIRNLENFQTSSGKSKKMRFDWLLLSKKYLPSAIKLYEEDLSSISFNYFCENLP